MNRLAAFDRELLLIFASVGAFLALASFIGWIFSKKVRSDAGRATVSNLNARIRAWWVMVAIFATSIALGPIGTYLLFGLISFWALREFITLTPTRLGDHRAFSGFSSSSFRSSTSSLPPIGMASSSFSSRYTPSSCSPCAAPPRAIANISWNALPRCNGPS
jgi:hypothetical protein